MSLFRTKQFWSNQCSSEEEYDQSSLKVSRINSDSDFVLIGSHSGYLRIYKPTGTVFGENACYRPNDLYLETNLGNPILQIDVGKLVSGSQTKQIAVLHSRSIGVYTLITQDGIAEHGTQNTLNLLYEHKLRRNAANFTMGAFGGVQNRDFLCVQSLDGMLTFFEQETLNFHCFLPEFLLPAPIVYAKSYDLFVTIGSGWMLKSYKYKTLSESADNGLSDEKSSKKIDTVWEYNIGEAVLDIQTLYDDISRQNNIAVLGEKNLYCFNDYRLRYMRKLDYLPQCFLFYYLDDGKCMFLVVAETNTLLLYEGTTLKWSAKLHFLPISIGRAFFDDINGALIMLSDDGYMQFAYLGTEPNLFVAPPMKNQDVDFEKVDEDLARLNKIIKSYQIRDDVNLSNANAEREIVVSLTVSPHIEKNSDDTTEVKKCCKIIIEIVPNAIFEEVHLSVSVQKPLFARPSSELYNNLCKTTSFTCFVYPGSTYAIPKLDIETTVSFVSSLGVPRICHKKSVVPFRLVYEVCPPLKDGHHKITLNLNQSSVPLSDLFSGEQTLSTTSNAIGLKHFMPDSPVVTIMAAKSSQRYRLQCDDIICLNLAVKEVIRRLKNHYMNHSNFILICASPLPINEGIKSIKNHFERAQKVKSLQDELNLLSCQYRIIQKRLIAKFKQKNPTPLSSLDILLQSTYQDIVNLIERLENEKDFLEVTQIELSCILNLITSLLNLLDDSDKCLEMVVSALSSRISDYENQNWEDVIDASLCYLLRTCLIKSEKDKLRAPHTSFEEIKDISKLEKHFIQVLERISKKPILDSEANEEESTSVIPEEQTIVQQTSDLGTEFASASTRALSARQSLLKRRYKANG